MNRSQLSQGASQELPRKEEGSWYAHTNKPKDSLWGMCAHTHSETHTLTHTGCIPHLLFVIGAVLFWPELIYHSLRLSTPPPPHPYKPPSTHNTPYQLPLRTSFPPPSPLLSLSLFTSPCLSFLLLSLTPVPPIHTNTHYCPLQRNLAMHFNSNEMHFPSSNSITECCVQRWFMNTSLYCQDGMKEETDSHDSL